MSAYREDSAYTRDACLSPHPPSDVGKYARCIVPGRELHQMAFVSLDDRQCIDRYCRPTFVYRLVQVSNGLLRGTEVVFRPEENACSRRSQKDEEQHQGEKSGVAR